MCLVLASLNLGTEISEQITGGIYLISFLSFVIFFFIFFFPFVFFSFHSWFSFPYLLLPFSFLLFFFSFSFSFSFSISVTVSVFYLFFFFFFFFSFSFSFPFLLLFMFLFLFLMCFFVGILVLGSGYHWRVKEGDRYVLRPTASDHQLRSGVLKLTIPTKMEVIILGYPGLEALLGKPNVDALLRLVKDRRDIKSFSEMLLPINPVPIAVEGNEIP